MISYGDEIAAERRRKRLSQEKAARVLGIKLHTLIDVELNRLEISESQFEAYVAVIREYEPDTANSAA